MVADGYDVEVQWITIIDRTHADRSEFEDDLSLSEGPGLVMD